MRLTEKQKETLKNNNIESNRVTREAIRDALYLLMDRKPYEKITITDIINKSGVSRSAFYRNYKTKEDIIYDIINVFIESFEIYRTSSLEHNWNFGFQYLIENKRNMELILQANLEHVLLDTINKNLRHSWNNADIVQAMNNGLIFNVFIHWARCGMPEESGAAALKIVEAYKTMIREVEEQY